MKDESSDAIQYDYQKLNELVRLMDGESLLNLILSNNPFYRSSICKTCGGICCKLSACSAIPKDFDSNISVMESCISTGKYCISYMCKKGYTPLSKNGQVIITNEEIQAEKIALVVRPRNVASNIIDFAVNSTGPCALWSSTGGCALSDEKRPTGAKGLIPLRPGICREIYDFDSFIKQWIPYQEALFALIDKYQNQESCKEPVNDHF